MSLLLNVSISFATGHRQVVSIDQDYYFALL